MLGVIERLRSRFDVVQYGRLDYGADSYPLLAIRSRDWRDDLPCALVTGGVHGYETSGVHGALQFVERHAADYDGRVNLLVAPCVSPWAYERIHRWNADADRPEPFVPRRQPGAGVGGADATGRAAARSRARAHRPARDHRQRRVRVPSRAGRARWQAVRAGRDSRRLLSGRRQRASAARVPAGGDRGGGEGHPHRAGRRATARSSARPWSRRASSNTRSGSSACARASPTRRYKTTTEVYPDSPRATPEQCNAAQAAAVRAAIDYALAHRAGAHGQG